MKPLQVVRDHPVRLAVGLVACFGTWLVFEAAGPKLLDLPLAPEVGHVTMVHPGSIQVERFDMARNRPEDPTGSLRIRDPFRPGVVTADLIPRLQPGMARVEVEELIGLPPAGLVHPVSNIDGKFTYRASYLANLDSKPAISTSPTPRSIIAIEFDATRPGHPLVKVHIPDPMS